MERQIPICYRNKVAYRNQRLKDKDNRFFDVELGAKGFLIQWLLFNNEVKFEYWSFFINGFLMAGMIVYIE